MSQNKAETFYPHISQSSDFSCFQEKVMILNYVAFFTRVRGAGGQRWEPSASHTPAAVLKWGTGSIPHACHTCNYIFFHSLQGNVYVHPRDYFLFSLPVFQNGLLKKERKKKSGTMELLTRSKISCHYQDHAASYTQHKTDPSFPSAPN